MPDVGEAAEPLVVRVYHADTDAGGVVHHGAYLGFLERARTEWLRRRGFPQQALLARGAVIVVRDLCIDYLRPARLDEELHISVSLQSLGAASLLVRQRVLRDGEPLVEARLRLACLDPVGFHPKRLPSDLAAELRHAL